jgi:hypothetical protein
VAIRRRAAGFSPSPGASLPGSWLAAAPALEAGLRRSDAQTVLDLLAYGRPARDDLMRLALRYGAREARCSNSYPQFRHGLSRQLERAAASHMAK